MEEKKNKKCLVIFIFTIIIALGVIIYLVYLLRDANKMINNLNENTTIKNAESGATLTEDDYDNYLKGLSNRSETSRYSVNGINTSRVTIFLTSENELYIARIDSDDETEDYVNIPGTNERGVKTNIKDVVEVFVGEIGNGGYAYIFVLKENGEIHQVSNDFTKTTKLDLKYIINIYEKAADGAMEMYAVDINGKTYNMNDYYKAE